MTFGASVRSVSNLLGYCSSSLAAGRIGAPIRFPASSCHSQMNSDGGDSIKPVIDLSKEYGLVLEGGGAKGAYQIGAWKALAEAGVKIKGIAGTSVGALNGALICMGDLQNALNVWENISYSRIMDVDDNKMTQLFNGEMGLKEALAEGIGILTDGGVDISPLKKLILDYIDEDAVQNSATELYVLTFSVDEMKELDVDLKEVDKSLIADFLLASAYIFPVFKSEKLHGKTYIDGGAINNVPLGSLVDRGYQDIIMIRIFGIGHEKKVKIPPDTTIYTVEPRVNLGNIIDFDCKKSHRNINIGYFDTMRLLYGLKGKIYYIEENEEECYYLNQLTDLDNLVLEYLMNFYHLSSEPESSIRKITEVILPVIAAELKLSRNWSYRELYLTMLEATAKLCRVQKYKIYSLKELQEEVFMKMYRLQGADCPSFVQFISKDVLI